MVFLYCCISFSLFHIYKVVHIPTFIEAIQRNFPLLDVYLSLILCGYLFFMILYLHYHFGRIEETFLLLMIQYTVSICKYEWNFYGV